MHWSRGGCSCQRWGSCTGSCEWRWSRCRRAATNRLWCRYSRRICAGVYHLRALAIEVVPGAPKVLHDTSASTSCSNHLTPRKGLLSLKRWHGQCFCACIDHLRALAVGVVSRAPKVLLHAQNTQDAASGEAGMLLDVWRGSSTISRNLGGPASSAWKLQWKRTLPSCQLTPEEVLFSSAYYLQWRVWKRRLLAGHASGHLWR